MILETDTQLIQQALMGDRLAAERLMERHRRSVLLVAYGALGNADDAQDAAQEALVYAHLRLRDLRDPGKFAAWLRHITLSCCADYRRRRGTRRLGISLMNEMGEETNLVERLMVRQSVSQLSDAHRTTLLLHYVGGWSLDEVATLLAIPVNTVRSRLMTAKRTLRGDLQPVFNRRGVAQSRSAFHKRTSMPTETITLTEAQQALIDAAFPGARILTVQRDIEPWMPFNPRVRLELADGAERTVDFRGDISPARAEQLPVLRQLGIPGPYVIHGPVPVGPDGHLTLCEPPIGENLLLWALGGTPHRIRLATERAFDGIERLQSLTDRLLADPIGAKLKRRTLLDEAARIEAKGGPWLADPWFTASLAKVKAAVADIDDPLVFTHYMHFFGLSYRLRTGTDNWTDDTAIGWPGDPALALNPLAEFVYPFGHIQDPIFGLAMVWIYDCYPFVHTGFVEQFLWRRNMTRRDFGPRLALNALRILQREVACAPGEGAAYRGYVEQGMSWM